MLDERVEGVNRPDILADGLSALAPVPGYPSGTGVRLANHSGGSARDSHPLPLAATIEVTALGVVVGGMVRVWTGACQADGGWPKTDHQVHDKCLKTRDELPRC
jgi:hypothetical protein